MSLLAENMVDASIQARIVKGCVLSVDALPCSIRKPAGMSSVSFASVAQIVDLEDPSVPIEVPPIAWSNGKDSTVRIHSINGLTAGHSYRVDFLLFGGAENGNR